MYVIEVFLLKIILLWYFFETIAAGTGYSFDTRCECLEASPNGTFCWSYKCRSDQITVCFSSVSTVEMKQNQRRMSMSHLKVGDEILVDINDHNERIYEPIYSFIHANPDGLYDYLKISVDNTSEQSLIISSNHLIYRANETNPVFAGHLKVGDQLQVISKDGIKQVGSIKNIHLVKSRGFYAPLTRSGRLVVNGIAVSNYAIVPNHRLAHLAMQPYRWWVQLMRSSSYSESINIYCQLLYKLVEQVNKWIVPIGLYDGYFIVSSL